MSKIYILKEEDEIRFTTNILGAFRKREKALEQLEKEAKVQKYYNEVIRGRYKDNLIIMGYKEVDDEEDCVESYVTRTLGVYETELK